MATVLVVDDNAGNRRLLDSLLRSRDHDPVMAVDGREGLRVARRLIGTGQGPDVVLLDLHMPVLDGFGFLAEWTADPGLVGIPVLIVSADVKEIVAGIEAGAHDYVTAPYDLNELLVRVAAALRVKALHDRLKDQQAELERLSNTDSLTGLCNRRGIQDCLEALAHAARRHGHPLAVLLADVDRFKAVNDDFGHDAGDHVLREFADRARACVRAEDSAGRWGGEEFLFALPFTDDKGAAVLAERLRTSVAGRPFRLSGGREQTVTVSIGGAVGCGADADALVRRADDALYAAKATGGNAVRLAAG